MKALTVYVTAHMTPWRHRTMRKSATAAAHLTPTRKLRMVDHFDSRKSPLMRVTVRSLRQVVKGDLRVEFVRHQVTSYATVTPIAGIILFYSIPQVRRVVVA